MRLQWSNYNVTTYIFPIKNFKELMSTNFNFLARDSRYA